MHPAWAQELERLRTIRDSDLPVLLAEAHAFAGPGAGEVAQIEEDLRVVGAEIERLERLVEIAGGARDDAPAAGTVVPGRPVDVEYVRAGSVLRCVIDDAGAERGLPVVEPASPVGRALLGRTQGDVVAVAMPAGYVEELRVLCVRP